MTKSFVLCLALIVLTGCDSGGLYSKPTAECAEWTTLVTSEKATYLQCTKIGKLSCYEPLEMYEISQGDFRCRMKK